jgi:hypothetical protein
MNDLRRRLPIWPGSPAAADPKKHVCQRRGPDCAIAAVATITGVTYDQAASAAFSLRNDGLGGMSAHASRFRASLIPLTLLCAASLAPFSHGDEPPLPQARQVRLESGRVIKYAIPFDRNALQDSLRIGNDLIALTSSGVLLRFELPDIRLVQERAEIEHVKCLGRGEGDAILAGLADGRICRVNPATLELIEIAKLPAPPQWIGWLSAATNRHAGLVVVTRPTRQMGEGDHHWDLPYSVVHDLVAEKTFTLNYAATAFLLDNTDRLWLGADNGEWGGRISRIDLAEGKLTAIKPPPARDPGRQAFWDGIYGFIELRDRQVWAYGGTMHVNLHWASITRIDEDKPRLLSGRELSDGQTKELRQAGPLVPISHIFEENDSLRVFSYNDVFRVDKTLKSWKKLATLSLHYRPGRPDAMGLYPAVRAVHPPARDGEPFILATIADGYLLLNGAHATSHALPGQSSAHGIATVLNTAEGTLIFEDPESAEAYGVSPRTWTLGAKGWNRVSLEPPAKASPPKQAMDEDDDSNARFVTRVLVDPTSGEIYTVTGTGTRGGTLTTARRSAGKTSVLGRETSSLEPASCFVTAGTLWHAAYGELKRFENGRWKTVLPLPDARGGHEFSPINKNGPPWILLDTPHHTLWRFEHDARAGNPRLSRLELREAAELLQTDTAIPWSNGALLLATDQGLRLFDPATAKAAKVDFPEPPHPPTVLSRDALGRLWLGGENGLYLIDPAEKTLESLDRVPPIRRNTVRSLAPDPRHADGMIAALGAQGVVFLRAPQTP